MASSLTYWDCSIWLGIHMRLKPSIFLWATMLIEANKVSSLFVFCWPTKSNILTGCSYSEATMKQAVLTVYMDFMMNVKENMTYKSGNNSHFASIGCLYQLLFLRRFYVCMVVFRLISLRQRILWEFRDLPTCLIKECYVICFGPTLIKTFKIGVRMTEEWGTHLESTRSLNSWKPIISIWYLEHTKSFLTAKNFSAKETL